MKKAISPLIGAILIIGFTIALAVVVMFWSSGFIKTTTTSTGEKVTEQITLLRDLEMKVRDATTNLTDSTVRIKVENKNEKKIEGFIVKIYSANDSFTNDSIDVSLEPFEIKYIIVGYDSSIGNITKIEVIPKVIVSQKEIAATLQSDEFIAPLITGAAPSGEFVADANTVLLFHFDKDAADEGEAKEYPYDSSMVGWWHFNGDASDSSGNGNDGTVLGAIVNTSGRFGSAFQFDGVDDYVQTTLAPSGWSAITMEAWIHLDAVDSYPYILSYGTNEDNNLELFFYASSGQIAFRRRSDNTGILDTVNLAGTGWHHIVGTSNGTNFFLYKDGTLVGSSALTHGINAATAFRIGRRSDDAGGVLVFNGAIDEVAIYNRSLSNPEIAQHAGILAKDYSNLGNNGTLTNGTNWTTAGKYGSGLQFDGVDDFVNISDSNSLDITGTLTLEAWVKGTYSPLTSIVSKFVNGDVTSTSYYLQTNGGFLRAYVVKDATNTILLSGNTNLGNNTWHHVAMTFDGSTGTVILYLDGLQDGTQTTAAVSSIQNTTTNVHIGASQESAGAMSRFFNGTIDEVRISNIARS